MNTDTKMYTIIKLIRSAIYVFIDTFFAVYFFKLCNYEILPISIYYLVTYIALLLAFIVLRTAIKRNVKVPYYRIGISLLAVYLALILLLKDKARDCIILIAFVKGLSEGMYFYPSNVLDAEKISNETRAKYSGTINIISVLIGIIMPLVIGFALTYYSYTNIGKLFMLLIALIFILSFWVKDVRYNSRDFNFKKFKKVIKTHPYLKDIFVIKSLSGFTFGGGSLGVIITLYSVIYFKTYQNIGILNSALAILSLITLSLYAYFVKPKSYQKIMNLSLIIIILSFLGLIIYPGTITLVIYLLLGNTFLLFINMLFSNASVDVTNNIEEIKKEFKAEYHLALEISLNICRIFSYVLFLLIGILGTKDTLYPIIIISLVSLCLLIFKLKKILKKIV